jgi:hydroxylamine reductase (hybrid-cluster protein)
MVCEMDNFTSIQSQEFLALFLTMINVEESIFINKINGSMKLNEMVKTSSATDAVKLVKEFINYDVTPILSERLVKENNQKAIRDRKIEELNSVISFLEEKKNEVSAAIKAIGESAELNEALNLIQSEINKKEKELANSYISESDEKKKVKENM